MSIGTCLLDMEERIRLYYSRGSRQVIVRVVIFFRFFFFFFFIAMHDEADQNSLRVTVAVNMFYL